MGREIQLNGGEISFLKMLGFSGAPMAGKLLAERMESMEAGEFLDTLNGLMALDYVVSNKVNMRSMREVETAFLRVNPAHARALRDAVNPGKQRVGENDRRQRRR